MPTKKINPAYAIAQARLESAYGHLRIHVYELIGNGATLQISSQVGGGGSFNTKLYSWNHGVDARSDPLKLPALQKATQVMRRIDRHLTQVALAQGHPESYVDYAIRVLTGAGITRVLVNENVNLGYSSEDVLPSFHPVKQHAELRAALLALEGQLLAKAT